MLTVAESCVVGAFVEGNGNKRGESVADRSGFRRRVLGREWYQMVGAAKTGRPRVKKM
jgi:hypothetical protein